MKHVTYLFIIILTFFMTNCGAPEDKSKGPKKPPPPKKEIKIMKSSSDDTKSLSQGASPEELKKAAEIIASVSADDIAAVDAKKKFKMFCTTCHGFTGDLNVNGAKDLTMSKISIEESVAQVYHGRGLMTPFKGILKDAEIVAVAKYIEGLRK